MLFSSHYLLPHRYISLQTDHSIVKKQFLSVLYDIIFCYSSRMSIKLELTTLQERLKGLRVAHHLNLEKLSKLIGLSKSVSGNYKTDDY